tara:strand:- start:931 stop:1350 length:420 start_codon:yes stop_codon:yes gene_type:complete
MKLSTWLVKNLNLIDCAVEEVRENGVFYGIKFSETVNRPGYHQHDGFPSHPVATRHVNQQIKHPVGITNPPIVKTPADYHSSCTEIHCEDGKYKKNDGSYGICYRCDGKGYITNAKHIKNQQYDRRTSGLDNASLSSLL